VASGSSLAKRYLDGLLLSLEVSNAGAGGSLRWFFSEGSVHYLGAC